MVKWQVIGSDGKRLSTLFNQLFFTVYNQIISNLCTFLSCKEHMILKMCMWLFNLMIIKFYWNYNCMYLNLSTFQQHFQYTVFIIAFKTSSTAFNSYLGNCWKFEQYCSFRYTSISDTMKLFSNFFHILKFVTFYKHFQ